MTAAVSMTVRHGNLGRRFLSWSAMLVAILASRMKGDLKSLLDEQTEGFRQTLVLAFTDHPELTQLSDEMVEKIADECAKIFTFAPSVRRRTSERWRKIAVRQLAWWREIQSLPVRADDEQPEA